MRLANCACTTMRPSSSKEVRWCVVVSVPRVPGTSASLDRVSPQPPQVDILPYHDLAAGKYLQLGRANPYNRKPLAKEVLEKWRLAVAELGTQVNVGG